MASSIGLSSPQIDPGRTNPDGGGGGGHGHSLLASSSKPHKNNLHHHDDVWNEEATFALLQAWGTKFVELNHGGLSRADWSHVKQQVILHSGKASLTDTQCRNRIDTLKKKYKREKHKIATVGASSSSWVYFSHMDTIINPTPKPSSQSLQPILLPPAAAIPIAAIPMAAADHGTNGDACMDKNDNTGKDGKRSIALEAPGFTNGNHGHGDAPNIVSASCEPPEESEMSQTSLNSSENDCKEHHERTKRQRNDGSALRVLAKALAKFADVYERIETAKLQHALDLEKTRMEVARNFELQKWQLLLQTQMELAKLKEGADDAHSFVDDMSANLFAACFMPADHCLRSLP